MTHIDLSNQLVCGSILFGSKGLKSPVFPATALELYHTAAIGEDQMNYVLHFKKHAEKDMYYFNKFEAQLLPKDAAQTFIHTFYYNQNITAKEAYNLLKYGEQTAVYKSLFNKEGEKYNAWITLDLTHKDEHNNFIVKQYHENYYQKQPFVLADALSAISTPIKELENEAQKATIEKLLKKGNAVEVTIFHNDAEEKGFLMVNAKAGYIEVYDAGMHPIAQQQGEQVKQQQEPQQTTTGEVKKKSAPQMTTTHQWKKAANYNKGLSR